MRLPTLLSAHADGDTARFELALSEELDAFSGHFPGMPVLPGVVQIDWAIRLALAHGLICEVPATRDFQVKFHSLVRPGMPLALVLRVDRLKGWLFFDYLSGETTMSAGRVVLESSVS